MDRSADAGTIKAVSAHRMTQVACDGTRTSVVRSLAEEVPIAFEFDGIGYAVLMASPTDLVDLAYGFAFTERLIDGPDGIRDVDCHDAGEGVIVRVVLRKDLGERVRMRVRHRTSDSSCGLCGIENLDQTMRALPKVPRWIGETAAIFAASAALAGRQPLNALTRSVHAAAQCTVDGTLRIVREDVGRHNALDKLIGAMLRTGSGWNGGFALLSSRCSYELVEKAALSGCPMLATVSAPTALALRRAAQAGMTLHVVARQDALLET